MIGVPRQFLLYLVCMARVGTDFACFLRLGAVGLHDQLANAAGYVAGSPEQRARVLQQLATQFVIEDLERWRPVMVAVAQNGQHPRDLQFDVLPFFMAEAAFRAAWSCYRLVRSVDGHDVYRHQD